MATNFTESNGWIPEPIQGPVLQKVLRTSAVEAAGRKVQMSTRTVRVPRHDASGVDIVAEHGTIPLSDATLDEVTLTALKFANRHSISLEATRDAIANEIDTFKLRWASNFAVKLDNACLGATGGVFNQSVYEACGGSPKRSVTDGVLNATTTVTSASANFQSRDVGAAISGTGIPAGTTIASVTNSTTVVLSAAATATASGVSLTITAAAGVTSVVQTAGQLSLAELAAAVGDMEAGEWSDDLIVIAHPKFAMQLRQMYDHAGFRVLQDPLQAGVPDLYGHPVYFSKGAVASQGASDQPVGNPLLIVGSKRNLILGVRDGVESAISDQAAWDTDDIELKMRARRGFAVATGAAFRVLEYTAS